MDYCTLWLDRLLWWDWSSCCAAHDQDYVIGIVKPIADYFLMSCANAELPGMGTIMWLGVSTIFGLMFYRRATRARAARKAETTHP